MCKGFMRISREKMSDWRWLENQTKFYVFFRLLMMANFKDKPFEKIVVKRGQLVFSYDSLSAQLKVPLQTLRTTLRDLQSTNEISIHSTRKWSLLTICDYESWQENETETNTQSTRNQHASNTQVTLSEINDNKEIKEKKENNISFADFEVCWKAYNRKGSKKKSLEQWQKLTDEERKKVLSHIRAYVASRDVQFQKDFERYLRDKTFTTIVIRGNSTIYDPDQSGEYSPQADGIFQYWNAERHCLIFNGDIEHLEDGYTAENRPNGAKCAWGMYEWVWNGINKEWVKK